SAFSAQYSARHPVATQRSINNRSPANKEATPPGTAFSSGSGYALFLIVSGALPVDDVAQGRSRAGSGVLVSFHVGAAGLFASGPEGQADLLFFRIHLDDLEIVLLAGIQLDRGAIGIGGFRVVAQPLHALGNFHEGAELRQAQHLAMHHVANTMGLEEALPRVGPKLFHSQ